MASPAAPRYVRFRSPIGGVGPDQSIVGSEGRPRAFSLRMQRTLKQLGYIQGIMDPQIWRLYKAPSQKRHSVVRELLTVDDTAETTRNDFHWVLTSGSQAQISGVSLRLTLMTLKEQEINQPSRNCFKPSREITDQMSSLRSHLSIIAA